MAELIMHYQQEVVTIETTHAKLKCKLGDQHLMEESFDNDDQQFSDILEESLKKLRGENDVSAIIFTLQVNLARTLKYLKQACDVIPFGTPSFLRIALSVEKVITQIRDFYTNKMKALIESEKNNGKTKAKKGTSLKRRGTALAKTLGRLGATRILSNFKKDNKKIAMLAELIKSIDNRQTLVRDSTARRNTFAVEDAREFKDLLNDYEHFHIYRIESVIQTDGEEVSFEDSDVNSHSFRLMLILKGYKNLSKLLNDKTDIRVYLYEVGFTDVKEDMENFTEDAFIASVSGAQEKLVYFLQAYQDKKRQLRDQTNLMEEQWRGMNTAESIEQALKKLDKGLSLEQLYEFEFLTGIGRDSPENIILGVYLDGNSDRLPAAYEVWKEFKFLLETKKESMA